MHTLIHIIRCHGSEVYLVMALIQNDDSYLSNELAHVGKSSEVVAIMKNWMPGIGLFQGGKCENVLYGNLECVQGKSVVAAVILFSSFHIIIIIISTKCLRASSIWHIPPMGPSYARGCVAIS